MVWRHPPVHGTGKSLEFRGSVVLPWQIPDAGPYGMQRLIPIPPAVFGFSAGVPGHPPKSHSPGLILEQPATQPVQIERRNCPETVMTPNNSNEQNTLMNGRSRRSRPLNLVALAPRSA